MVLSGPKPWVFDTVWQVYHLLHFRYFLFEMLQLIICMLNLGQVLVKCVWAGSIIKCACALRCVGDWGSCLLPHQSFSLYLDCMIRPTAVLPMVEGLNKWLCWTVLYGFLWCQVYGPVVELVCSSMLILTYPGHFHSDPVLALDQPPLQSSSNMVDCLIDYDSYIPFPSSSAHTNVAVSPGSPSKVIETQNTPLQIELDLLKHQCELHTMQWFPWLLQVRAPSS